MGEVPVSLYTYQSLLRWVREKLSSRDDLLKKGLLQVEAEQIVMGSFRYTSGSQMSRSDFYFKQQEIVSSAHVEVAFEFTRRRLRGELLQHILGYQYFFAHEYEVNQDVLIPRPETEVLLSVAIDALKKSPHVPRLGFEVGLGSGILSIELLDQFQSLRMIASEVSARARDLALRNAQRILSQSATRLTIHPVEDLQDVCGSLLSLGVQADFMISNPPYLLSHDEEVEDEVLAHEPHEALFGPPENPLYYYEQMALYASGLLTSDGLMFLELPHERSQDIVKLLQRQNWETSVFQDLTKRDRVCVAQWRGEKV